MARSFPPDVVVLDTDALIHARLGRGRTNPRISQAKSYSLRDGVFTPSVVTPELANEGALAETLKRMKLETGRWDKVSLLLPDSWFRMNLLDLPSLPERRNEAMEMIRWSLKRTMPVDPTALRVAYEVLSKTRGGGARVLALSAIEKTLAGIEGVFAAAGIEVVLVEAIGLNIWNAITARETVTGGDRLFFYIREGDFTTAVFRGAQPLFIRTRNLAGERSLQQEIRLSATYLRDTLQTTSVESCWVAGNDVPAAVTEAIGGEFSAPVRRIALSDVVEDAPEDAAAFEAELTACTGVFTA
jgi:type IV pilus assembly protein PilM